MSCAVPALAKPLPPYGRDHIERGRRDSAFVAMGPGASALARRRWNFYPVMVLPEDEDAFSYDWPVAELPVVLFEVGTFDTDRLERCARALITAGSPLVTTIREALLPSHAYPPYVASPIFTNGSMNAHAR